MVRQEVDSDRLWTLRAGMLVACIANLQVFLHGPCQHALAAALSRCEYYMQHVGDMAL